MDIAPHGEGPRYCARCGRHIDTAIKEQTDARVPCHDGKCAFKKEIKAAMEAARRRRKFTIKPYEKPAVKFKILPLK